MHRDVLGSCGDGSRSSQSQQHWRQRPWLHQGAHPSASAYLGPRLCLLQPSRRRHCVIWPCAHREAPALTCPLATLQRVAPAYPMAESWEQSTFPLCHGLQPHLLQCISAPSSKLLLSWVFFLKLQYPLEFPFHFYSYSLIITVK